MSKSLTILSGTRSILSIQPHRPTEGICSSYFRHRFHTHIHAPGPARPIATIDPVDRHSPWNGMPSHRILFASVLSSTSRNFVNLMVAQVHHSVRISASVSCPVNASWFPFGSVSCPLRVASYSRELAEIQLSWDDGGLSHYKGAWVFR